MAKRPPTKKTATARSRKVLKPPKPDDTEDKTPLVSPPKGPPKEAAAEPDKETGAGTKTLQGKATTGRKLDSSVKSSTTAKSKAAVGPTVVPGAEAPSKPAPSTEAQRPPAEPPPASVPAETEAGTAEHSTEESGDAADATRGASQRDEEKASPPDVQAAPAQPESVQVQEPVPAAAPPPEPGQEPADTGTAPVEVHHGPGLYIVHIAPEMAPVAKVGGLADVVFGLTRELAIRGNQVEILLPKYDSLRYDQIYELHEVYGDLWVPWYDGAIHCTVYFGFVHDRKCFFIEPHSGDDFFNRGSIYGFDDDVMRYAFFSRAAMEFLFKAGKHPDIIHCHDWQSALAPVFLYEIYQQLGMTHPRVCLTIHNFKHQGLTGMEMLRATGLHQPEHFFDYNRLRDNNNPYALNLLKGGVVYSNFVTTVSPRYAFETRDLDQGFGLEPTLHTHHMKYGGVVNGIDYDVWNPELDHQIPVHYGVESIDGKYDNKRALRQRLMLADNEKPLVAFIGRLDAQKGLDLVRHAIFYALERGAQFVLLGSSPDQGINADFWGLKQMLNDSPDCHLEIGFDEDLSHLIYAGADMMLVPSRFEPCGLTQLIALRYGTIPVVRSVGGLADTVFDKDHAHRPLHERNGYVFEEYHHSGLESALGRAMACYFRHPDHFRDLMKNAMRSDYSWNIPGQDYLNIYEYIRHR